MVSKFSHQPLTDCPLLINTRRRINAVDASRPIRATDKQTSNCGPTHHSQSGSSQFRNRKPIPAFRHCDAGGRVAIACVRRFRAAPRWRCICAPAFSAL